MKTLTILISIFLLTSCMSTEKLSISQKFEILDYNKRTKTYTISPLKYKGSFDITCNDTFKIGDIVSFKMIKK